MNSRSATAQKEIYSSSRKYSAEVSQTDWVCTNCHNLNFSFRKKCNRCKIQSRQDNDRGVLPPNYNYYESFYAFPPPPPATQHQIDIITTPRKNKDKCFFTQRKIEETKMDQLPSVSPLLKKYRAAKDSKPKRSTQRFQMDSQSIFSYESWDNFYSNESEDEKDQEKSTDEEEGNPALCSILNLMII